MAQVWRRVRSRNQGVDTLKGAPDEALPFKGSDSLGSLLRVLSRYGASHRNSQRKPSEPVKTNAQRQLQVRAIQGTMRGVRIAPVFVPALKMPVARARSSLGNHSPTLLMAPGKLADSPRPSSARAAENAAVVRASAWPIAARLHTTTAVAKPRRT